MAFVLMVDDDKDILELGRVVLGAAHHHVWTATSVIDALELLKTRAFDLVITDANMRPYSGYDFLKTIRAEPAWRELPVAMLTGRRDKKDIERAVEGGVSDYIIKPIDPALLQKKVADLVARANRPPARPETPTTQITETAFAMLQVELQTLSEMGASVLTNVQLGAGQIILLESQTLSSLGIPSPQLLVESCVASSARGAGQRFLVTGRFENLQERFALRIRAWVHQRKNHGSIQESRKGAA